MKDVLDPEPKPPVRPKIRNLGGYEYEGETFEVAKAFYLAIIIFTIVLILTAVSSYSCGKDKEIQTSSYLQVQKMIDVFPDLQPMVDYAMKDNIITINEFDTIYSEFEKLSLNVVKRNLKRG